MYVELSPRALAFFRQVSKTHFRGGISLLKVLYPVGRSKCTLGTQDLHRFFTVSSSWDFLILRDKPDCVLFNSGSNVCGAV